MAKSELTITSRWPECVDCWRGMQWNVYLKSINLIGRHYLSNATCLRRPPLCYALFLVSRISNNSLHSSTLSKNTCVRQVVLDKWLPTNNATLAWVLWLLTRHAMECFKYGFYPKVQNNTTHQWLLSCTWLWIVCQVNYWNVGCWNEC